jgi:nitrogen fixation-related uncharacterized protein
MKYVLIVLGVAITLIAIVAGVLWWVSKTFSSPTGR